MRTRQNTETSETIIDYHRGSIQTCFNYITEVYLSTVIYSRNLDYTTPRTPLERITIKLERAGKYGMQTF